jgi:hypothetical protein
MVARLLAAGWDAPGLVAALSTGPLDKARSVAATLRWRIANAVSDVPPTVADAAVRPKWCGECSDDRTRQRENDQGQVVRCPTCHPNAVPPAALDAVAGQVAA